MFARTKKLSIALNESSTCPSQIAELDIRPGVCREPAKMHPTPVTVTDIDVEVEIRPAVRPSKVIVRCQRGVVIAERFLAPVNRVRAEGSLRPCRLRWRRGWPAGRLAERPAGRRRQSRHANRAAAVTVTHFRPANLAVGFGINRHEIIQHGASGAKTKFDLIRTKLITVMLYFRSRNKSVNLS